MKKIFKLEELDCAHCAAKMERSINKLEGVQNASINFFAQKLVLEAEEENFDEILRNAQKEISRIEPDCRILTK